jgi:hypothetical protein
MVTARLLCLYLEEHAKDTLEDVSLLVSNLRSLGIPKDHAAASCDAAESGTSRLSLSALTLRAGEGCRASGLRSEIRARRIPTQDAAEPRPDRRHPAIEASERNRHESRRYDRPRPSPASPRSPAEHGESACRGARVQERSPPERSTVWRGISSRYFAHDNGAPRECHWLTSNSFNGLFSSRQSRQRSEPSRASDSRSGDPQARQTGTSASGRSLSRFCSPQFANAGIPPFAT